MVADKLTMLIWSKNGIEYSLKTRRAPLVESKAYSFFLLLIAKNKVRKNVQRISQTENGTSITTAPATTRNTKPIAIEKTSRIMISFNLSEYRRFKIK